jgi:15-cis-phytoene desaturase
MQPYLGSMEGAVLSGKLTAQAIAEGRLVANSSNLQMQTPQPATNAATV